MHRPAMAEPRLLQDAAHPRRVCAHQVHDARLLIRHLPHAVQAVQPGGRQQPDLGQIDDHRPAGPPAFATAAASAAQLSASTSPSTVTTATASPPQPCIPISIGASRRSPQRPIPLWARSSARKRRRGWCGSGPPVCRCTGSGQDRLRGPGRARRCRVGGSTAGAVGRRRRGTAGGVGIVRERGRTRRRLPAWPGPTRRDQRWRRPCRGPGPRSVDPTRERRRTDGSRSRPPCLPVHRIRATPFRRLPGQAGWGSVPPIGRHRDPPGHRPPGRQSGCADARQSSP